uniref:Ras-GEF domain-containing protein n=1 Tax=Macaca nemestrina TaxID=9545 RepID=A0A2K6ANG1_MACNE
NLLTNLPGAAILSAQVHSAVLQGLWEENVCRTLGHRRVCTVLLHGQVCPFQVTTDGLGVGTITCVFFTWPLENTSLCYQPPQRSSFQIKLAFSNFTRPGLGVEDHQELVLGQLLPLEPIETKPDDPAPHPGPQALTMPALEPAPPLLADLGPALEPKSRVALEAPGYLHSPPAPAPGEGSTPVTVLEPQSTRESPCPCPVNNQPTEELPDVTTFPPRLLAEQLTLMDALSQTSLSLRRGQYPGTNCSSTSYQPRDPDEGPHWKLSPMKLEFSGFSNKRDWMGTHKSLCLFTNLPFFLSSVHSKSTKYLKQLCKTDTAVKRDLLIKVQWNSGKPRHVNLRWHRRRPLPEWRKRRLDSAIPDDLDGNINKKRKEVRVLQEMQLLQVAAMNYRLRPLEKFVTYFKRLEQLSDKESYKLSCQLEPKSQ